MKHKFSFISIASLLAGGIVSASIVAPAYAKSGGGNGNVGGNNTNSNPILCHIQDIQFGSLTATACKGPFSGNDTGAGAPLETQLDADLFDSVDPDADWSLLGKSDDANPTFITAGNGSTGTIKLGGNLSDWVGKTFVISLKAANSYSAYLFQNFQGTTLEAMYNTINVARNNNGNAQGLSHASLYIANLPQTPPPRLPEPASLLGFGLIATGMLTVRRQRSI